MVAGVARSNDFPLSSTTSAFSEYAHFSTVVDMLEGTGAGAAQVLPAGPPDCPRPAGRPVADGMHGDVRMEGMTGMNGGRSVRAAPGGWRMALRSKGGLLRLRGNRPRHCWRQLLFL